MKFIKLIIIITLSSCSHLSYVKRDTAQSFLESCKSTLKSIFYFSDQQTSKLTDTQYQNITLQRAQYKLLEQGIIERVHYSRQDLLQIAYHPLLWNNLSSSQVRFFEVIGLVNLNERKNLSEQILKQITKEPIMAQRLSLTLNLLSKHLLENDMNNELWKDLERIKRLTSKAMNTLQEKLDEGNFSWVENEFKLSRNHNYQNLLSNLFSKRSQFILENAQFITNRTMFERASQSSTVEMSYEQLLPNSFHDTIIKSNQKIIDMGVGQASAWIDYFERFGVRFNSKVYGITFNAPDKKRILELEKLSQNNFEFLSGQFVEDLSFENLRKLKNSDLILDVHGALAYTTKLSDLLQIYFDSLKFKGSIMSHISNTHIVTKEGKQLNLYEWLDTIEGISVKTERKKGIIVYTIVKNAAQINIPKLSLYQNMILEGPPPKRVFVAD